MVTTNVVKKHTEINEELLDVIKLTKKMKSIAEKTNESKILFQNTINKLDTILVILKRKE